MKQYRHLQQFWCWLDDVEGIFELSPFCKMEASRVPGNPPTVLRENGLTELLVTANGKIFVELRDWAIIVVLIDCGVRGRRTAAVDGGKSGRAEARQL
ncbi:hypothetical protein F9C11_21890 [Amycolatopsis sp. VS8301801F10]|uniref:hypothetical protein n=1 Tax=Amycolatopsis sp. VS8301801F10 TaxID=2652442 RepID=UPI0038FD266C